MMEIKQYKGVLYYFDSDNLWKVFFNERPFIVAFDDSKERFSKRIEWKYNNEQTCKEYINWLIC